MRTLPGSWCHTLSLMCCLLCSCAAPSWLPQCQSTQCQSWLPTPSKRQLTRRAVWTHPGLSDRAVSDALGVVVTTESVGRPPGCADWSCSQPVSGTCQYAALHLTKRQLALNRLSHGAVWWWNPCWTALRLLLELHCID